MRAEELWNAFIEKNHVACDSYEAWAFGDNPELLTELVLKGIKTGTSSLYVLYELEDEPLPKSDEYSVILDEHGNARCIIRTTKVDIIPFCEVTEEHAMKEGERDRTLKTWREIHRAFFSKCLEETGMTFDETMLVVYEEFEVVYKG